jgi:hypothetical protein
MKAAARLFTSWFGYLSRSEGSADGNATLRDHEPLRPETPRVPQLGVRVIALIVQSGRASESNPHELRQTTTEHGGKVKCIDGKTAVPPGKATSGV